MPAYYNEIDPHAAQWLRNLIAAGHIAPGDVDERSIVEVRPDDLRGYEQCHFFAGIGGWSYALRLAGIPDDRPIWSGSCPCQPFSNAGQQRGFADERHLWPAFFALIRECRPRTVLGEQVAGAGGIAWWDQVALDLEDEDYAAAAANLGAHTVGAPHVRQRLYWVANTNSNERHATQGYQDARTDWRNDIGGRGENGMADPMHTQRRENHVHRANGRDGPHDGRKEAYREPGTCGEVFRLGDSNITGLEGWGNDAPEYASQRTVRPSSPWDQAEWVECSDGKSRPTQPSIFPLVNGISKSVVRCGNRSMVPDADQSAEARTMRLKGYGNAIVPQVAAIFITAAMQSL
ncbi:MAG: DNA cytosine methyltransferase [Candidatus Obscuribacter sp.]|nr:DNA cytosine methyltransferase [Candidatus Obscuribacter sp.]